MTVDRAISWAWKSIISTTAKKKLAFVPYSTDERQKSRWGGLDFDCHDGGDADRARELAFAAFRVLLNVPEVCVILETSGSGGWHVWGISQEFHDTQEWIRLLKDVARLIGVPIAPGLCEIFPPDSLPSRFGKGMRAPGCWNPSTDTCSEVVWENTRSFHAQFYGPLPAAEGHQDRGPPAKVARIALRDTGMGILRAGARSP